MAQQTEQDGHRRGSSQFRTTAFHQDQTKTSQHPATEQDQNHKHCPDSDQDSPGPSRPRHRPLVQSASYQPGDTLRYRPRWLQDLDPDRDPGEQERYRVVLIGDHNVGKSSLASVFAGNSDQDQDENQERTFERTVTVDGEDTTLTVMDTWDKQRTEYSLSIGTAYVIVYSVTDRSSFDTASELRITVRRARQNERLPIILVGNKSDLVRSREVHTQEGLACAVVFDCKFIETSAVLHLNVLELFEGVVRQIRLHREPPGDAVLTLTPHHSPCRKESLTQKARRLLGRLVSRNNQRLALRARSKSCHDLTVL